MVSRQVHQFRSCEDHSIEQVFTESQRTPPCVCESISYNIEGRRCCFTGQRRSLLYKLRCSKSIDDSIHSTTLFVQTNSPSVCVVHVVNHLVTCCMSLLPTSSFSLDSTAGVRVGDSAKSPSVGYVPSGDLFGSLNPPYFGERRSDVSL